jgi:hypothetical protein
MAKKKAEKPEQSPVLAALQKASMGLQIPSETEVPLEPSVWEDGGGLDKKKLLAQAGAQAGAAVEEETLEDCFHAVPPEDNAKFDKLAQVLKDQLAGVKVYGWGTRPRSESSSSAGPATASGRDSRQVWW